MIQHYYDFEEIVELLEKNKLVIQEKFSLEDLKFIEEIIKKIKASKQWKKYDEYLRILN
jgi:hypothetical protein